MRYTFVNKQGKEQTVTVPDSYIKKSRSTLGLTVNEAVEMYLSDEGYIENAVVAELTAKAKGQRIDTGAGRKTRKAPSRKPDEVKRKLIQDLSSFLSSLGETEDVEVTNIERIIAFQIGDDKYELTLSKKRKPKT